MLRDNDFRIGGLIKVDSVNYPGFVACTVFTKGCNFRCPYCHNPSLVENVGDVETHTVQEVFDYLEKRKNLLDAVVVSGGEPCIQKGLGLFFKEVKALGLRTKLDTNGSFPSILEDLLQRELVDYVAMDVKTSVSNYGRLGLLDANGVERSVRIVMEMSPDYEFRTTCEKSVVSPNDFKALGQWLKGAKRLFLQQFNPKVTLDEKVKNSKQYSYEELEGFARELSVYVTKVSIR